MSTAYDGVVVGGGPNGLAAAITLAQAGCRVLLVEGADAVGGGARTAELTLPGFRHDVCSAVHPLGLVSPFLAAAPLATHGVEWLHPQTPLAHPLDGQPAALLERSVASTAAGLAADGPAYTRLMAPLVRDARALVDQFVGPPRLPRHPVAAARFGLSALRSASGLAGARFGTERAAALLAGIAGHAMLPLEARASAASGLLLGLLGHACGWPLPRGGSQTITDALAAHLEGLGGVIETGTWVKSVDDLPSAKVVLLDVAPSALDALAGHRLPGRYRASLTRFRHGPGACKVDFALDGPVPWADPTCAGAGTVHVGGTLPEIAATEREVVRGRHPDRPFVVVAQPSVVDPGRAPRGRHVLWAYCHVPHGSTRDMAPQVTAQIERFAPGFRDRVLATSTLTAAALAEYNPNYVGGDIACGAMTLRQLLFRPAVRANPYATPDPQLFLCSSATPPGPGVHGMCGMWAARAALRRL